MPAHSVPFAKSRHRAANPTVALLPGRNVHVVPAAHSTHRAMTPGIGDVPGDDFYAPILLTGVSGSISQGTANHTLQAGEPTPDAGDRSLWLRMWPPASGSLRIVPGDDAADDIVVDVWDGTDVTDLERRLDPLSGDPEGAPGFVSPIVDIDLTADTRVRLTPNGSGLAEFTWAFIPEANTLDMQLDRRVLPRSPGVLQLNIMGADPGETVRFTVIGVSGHFDMTADASGGILRGTYQVVRGFPVGTHVLRATGLTSGRVAEETFTVEKLDVRPTPPPADAPPTLVVQSGVRRFVFQDPLDGGLGQYIFPINPVAASDPFPPRYVTPEHTAALNGQWILWEGAERAVPWTITGRAPTAGQVAAFKTWRDCLRRIYIHDHLNRAFLVHIRGITLEPDPKPREPDAHTYEIAADVYGWSQL